MISGTEEIAKGARSKERNTSAGTDQAKECGMKVQSAFPREDGIRMLCVRKCCVLGDKEKAMSIDGESLSYARRLRRSNQGQRAGSGLSSRLPKKSRIEN